jgi:hypothetical protein
MLCLLVRGLQILEELSCPYLQEVRNSSKYTSVLPRIALVGCEIRFRHILTSRYIENGLIITNFFLFRSGNIYEFAISSVVIGIWNKQ